MTKPLLLLSLLLTTSCVKTPQVKTMALCITPVGEISASDDDGASISVAQGQVYIKTKSSLIIVGSSECVVIRK